ncbi:DNA polymerase IV [Gorillibacterium massiliense]|uniref:DNA polymerase IV n=1 Tax=Gorillibacterium massiliense TaxID=1280390 RepID=UPI0004B19F95|nr:DNA polymerase IV [Gorillibacterium massiliense]
MAANERVIMLVDGQSFYASVEKAAHPDLENRPVAVGDPSRRSGIILAACPLAKARGVTTASRVGEALGKCPELTVIRPRMQTYVNVSMLISSIFETFTDLVEPYSIDEQFLDVTGMGNPLDIARSIQTRVKLSTGVWSRVGIAPTKILAKMATDNFAKKRTDGVFTLGPHNIEELWQLPVHQMFMVNSRMTFHFNRMGFTQIGDIARLDQMEFRRKMRREMGKQSDIQADYYWQTARGIDPSPVQAKIRNKLKSVSHGKTLRASLYRNLADIQVVLLELVVEVCRRARRHGNMGRVVSVGAVETDGTRAWSFNRQTTLQHPTSLTHEMAEPVMRLFAKYWSGSPVSHLYVSLNSLSDDNLIQLSLFDDRVKALRMEKTIDRIKDRYGSAAIMRASSLLEAGVARERAGQIGGHYK